MQLDDTTISRAITETFMKEFLDYLEVDAAIVGAGPAGMTAAYYLAKEGIKTVVFERALKIGGGMPGFIIVPCLYDAVELRLSASGQSHRVVLNIPLHPRK